MARRHDHATASVATLRAELAELRPRLAQAERERDDARSLNELLDAAHRKVTAERDEALADVAALKAENAVLVATIDRGGGEAGWDLAPAVAALREAQAERDELACEVDRLNRLVALPSALPFTFAEVKDAFTKGYDTGLEAAGKAAGPDAPPRGAGA